MENKKFLNVNDVARYMEISRPTAYKIIRTLNDQLREEGYITVAGKISRSYFEQKTFGTVA